MQVDFLFASSFFISLNFVSDLTASVNINNANWTFTTSVNSIFAAIHIDKAFLRVNSILMKHSPIFEIPAISDNTNFLINTVKYFYTSTRF